MFLHINDTAKLPKLLKNKNIDHIILIDHKGELAKNPPFPNDYEVIKLNMKPKNNKKGNEDK